MPSSTSATECSKPPVESGLVASMSHRPDQSGGLAEAWAVGGLAASCMTPAARIPAPTTTTPRTSAVCVRLMASARRPHRRAPGEEAVRAHARQILAALDSVAGRMDHDGDLVARLDGALLPA